MKILRAIALCALLATSATVAEAQCSSFAISTTGVAFGVYDPLNPGATTSTGTIEVSCSGDIGVEVAYSISLGRGFAASYQPREMAGASNELAYNLFSVSLNGLIWGDGTGGSQTVSDLVPLLRTTEYREYTVYGTIFPRQQVASGAYSDSIVITVSF